MKSLFKHPSKSPGFLLWKLTTEWQRQQRQALAAFKLTHVQFVFLACLGWLSSQNHSNITQSQLAEFSKLDKMVISETTRKLLKKHLITRGKHTNDSRSYALKLTLAGKNLVDQALSQVEAVDQMFFSVNKQQLLTLNKLSCTVRIKT